MERRHTDREYEQQLQDLREILLQMGVRVEDMIASSVQALVDGDVNLARKTIQVDQSVNRAEMEADELCLRILARRQPVASDLRFITLGLKMVTDLERIGDLAVNICERVIDLADEPPLPPRAEIPEMAELVRGMIRDAIDAFVEADADKALDVIQRDDQVDALYGQLFREVLELMLADSAAVERGIHLQSVAKWLERIADHGTNLAEQVIFMVRGRDVRHIGKL